MRPVFTFLVPMRPLEMEAKIQKFENSAVMSLIPEMLAILAAKEGDTLFVI